MVNDDKKVIVFTASRTSPQSTDMRYYTVMSNTIGHGWLLSAY